VLQAQLHRVVQLARERQARQIGDLTGSV